MSSSTSKAAFLCRSTTKALTYLDSIENEAACEYGHLHCADREGGACSNEVFSILLDAGIVDDDGDEIEVKECKRFQTAYTFFADLNPAYPSRGQHRYSVFRREPDGSATRLTSRSFVTLRRAARAAHQMQVTFERRRRPVYLGD